MFNREIVKAPLLGAVADSKDLHTMSASALRSNAEIKQRGVVVSIQNGMLVPFANNNVYAVTTNDNRDYAINDTNSDDDISISISRKGVRYLRCTQDNIKKGDYLFVNVGGRISRTDDVGLGIATAHGDSFTVDGVIMAPVSYNFDLIKSMQIGGETQTRVPITKQTTSKSI